MTGSPATPLYQIAVGWAGYREPEPDEHSEALGEFPRMPEMPGEDDTLPDRIHSRDHGEIDVFGPSLWQRFKAWWQSWEFVD